MKNLLLALSLLMVSLTSFGMSLKVDIQSFDLDYKDGHGKLTAKNFEVMSPEVEMTSEDTDLLIQVSNTSMTLQKDELKLKLLGMKNDELAKTDLIARNATVILEADKIRLVSPNIKYNDMAMDTVDVNCEGQKIEGKEAAFADILRTCVAGKGYIKSEKITDVADSSSFLNLDGFQMRVSNNNFFLEGRTNKFLNPKLVINGKTQITKKHAIVKITHAKLGALSVKGQVLKGIAEMDNKNISVSGDKVYLILED